MPSNPTPGHTSGEKHSPEKESASWEVGEGEGVRGQDLLSLNDPSHINKFRTDTIEDSVMTQKF